LQDVNSHKIVANIIYRLYIAIEMDHLRKKKIARDFQEMTEAAIFFFARLTVEDD